MSSTDAPRLDRERAEALEEYVANRHALRLAWPSADVVIPDLLLFVRRSDERVFRVLVWQEDVTSLVVPEAADLLVVRPTPLARARSARPSALVERERALAILGDHARRHETPVPHWLYRGGDSHPLLVRAVREAAGETPSAFRAVRRDPIEVI